MTLTIMHTSDLHDRLGDAQAEALGFLRESAAALLLDSGDAVGAGNVYVRRSEPIIDRMNRAGYDAMAAGNREFFFRKAGMLAKTRQAQFPILATNVVPVEGDLGHMQRWTALSAQGWTIGLFGLMPTMIEPGHPFERFSDLRFMTWEAAAREAVEHLRERVELLIALSHRSTQDNVALARLCPEIDLVLGGHSHEAGSRQIGSRPTLLSNPGHHARTAAVVRVDRGSDGRNQFDWRLVEIA